MFVIWFIWESIEQCTIGRVSLTCEEFKVQSSVLGISIKSIEDRGIHETLFCDLLVAYCLHLLLPHTSHVFPL